MIHREAAERLSGEEAVEWSDDPQARYVVAGFNALSECEKRLFRRMYGSGRVEFYWDYDDYYVGNPDYEAGLFLRENIRNFPFSFRRASLLRPLPPSQKRIEIVSAPSDSMQCKYVHEFLSGLIERGIRPGKQTAIVLTDESLLLPGTQSDSRADRAGQCDDGLSDAPDDGLFVRRAARRASESQKAGPRRRADVLSQRCDRIASAPLRPGLRPGGGRACGRDTAPAVDLRAPEHARSGLGDRSAVRAGRLMAGAFRIYPRLAVAGDPACRVGRRCPAAEGVFFGDRRPDLPAQNSLLGSGLEVTTPVFASLLRKMLQDVRIPYEGEPLSGVQIMGILETRNLDFEHVLVLSVNDDTFPGNRAVASSFIPYNLRYAYGLPTPQHHEGVYAYYFYRLLQRAETVHLAYCSRSDDKRTGEPSRYVYQLEYESPHRPLRRAIRLGVNLAKTEPVSASKTGRTARILEEYLDGGGRSLSPTAFYQYVECPLRFYFRHVAGLKPVEEIAEEIDLPMFGTILHRAMELLYMPLLGDPNPQRIIASLPGTPAVKEAVVRAVNEEYLQDPKATEEEYGGSVLLVRDVVRKYIDSCILPYDASQRGYAVERLEATVEYRVPLERDGRVRSVGFAGKADRIDRLSDGALRVVDYKTGKPHNCFRDVAALFSSVAAERSPAVLQTLLYAMMLSQSENCDVQPALYYVRSMQDERFSPLLVEGDRPVLRFSDYRESLNGHLQKTLSELFDFSKPFEQCEDRSVCAYCDFREICRR